MLLCFLPLNLPTRCCQKMRLDTRAARGRWCSMWEGVVEEKTAGGAGLGLGNNLMRERSWSCFWLAMHVVFLPRIKPQETGDLGVSAELFHRESEFPGGPLFPLCRFCVFSLAKFCEICLPVLPEIGKKVMEIVKWFLRVGGVPLVLRLSYWERDDWESFDRFPWRGEGTRLKVGCYLTFITVHPIPYFFDWSSMIVKFVHRGFQPSNFTFFKKVVHNYRAALSYKNSPSWFQY